MKAESKKEITLCYAKAHLVLAKSEMEVAQMSVASYVNEITYGLCYIK